MYPSKADLKRIADWKGTLRELIEFLQGLWEYDPPVLRKGRSSFDRKLAYKLDVHTWGWSGNEDIIEALHPTMLWILYWRSSRRGGHYEFEIAPWALDTKGLEWGDPRRPEDRK